MKEVLRATAGPGINDQTRLKRILRYLVGRPRQVLRMPWQGDLGAIQTFVDSDFAGCRISRKSSIAGCIMWGNGVIKTWSRTLSTLALSTGEAELGALAKGAAESEGIVSILHDFGMQASICISSDASAAIGITRRLGLGRVRHL